MITVPKGYLEWDARTLQTPLTLAGRVLAGPLESLSWERQADVSILTAFDGSTIAQRILAGPDAPAGRSPFRARFRVPLVAEVDYQALEIAAATGRPVSLWPGWWQVDVWSVAAGGAARTTWRTSRRLPFEVPSYVPAPDLEPRAELDGVALTPVAADPAAGEVVLPTSNDGPEAHNATITTAPLDGAVELVLSYPAGYLVVLRDLKRSVARANLLVVEVEVEEHLPARFEAW